MRFTKAEAIEICQRELHYNPFKDYQDCYYFDGECELNLEDCSRNCIHFKSDTRFTNIVRKAILDDPEFCRENWEKLCQVDKELFNAIYGSDKNLCRDVFENIGDGFISCIHPDDDYDGVGGYKHKKCLVIKKRHYLYL